MVLNEINPIIPAIDTLRVVVYFLCSWNSVCLCPQGKLQKHQAFEAEVQANAGAIIKLDETGNLMISEGHFASETIRVKPHTPPHA